MEWRITDTKSAKRVDVAREPGRPLPGRFALPLAAAATWSATSRRLSRNHDDLRFLRGMARHPFRWIPVPAEPGKGRGVCGDAGCLRRGRRRRHGAGAVHADPSRRPFATVTADASSTSIHSFLPSFGRSRRTIRPSPARQLIGRHVGSLNVTAGSRRGPHHRAGHSFRIDHADSPGGVCGRVGRDIERTVLARGVRWHLEDRSAPQRFEDDRLA